MTCSLRLPITYKHICLVSVFALSLAACRSQTTPTPEPAPTATAAGVVPKVPIGTAISSAVTAAAQTSTPVAITAPAKPTALPSPTPPPPTPVPTLKPAANAGTIVVGNNTTGIEVELAAGAGTKAVKEAGALWIRYNGVVWADVEPNRGDRKWESQANLETRLKEASAAGLQTILIVRGAPAWARQIEKASCGPIKPDAMAYYVVFLRDMVARYSGPPFNVKYWEIWNEPDVSPEAVANIPDSPFGCWGDPKDAYFGGGQYGETLKVVYPLIKSADPKAQVLIGGLLLDCDPRVSKPDKDCKPAKFLEGILKNGGGPFFDGISFHAYDFFYGKPGHYGNANWDSVWNVTGPVLAAKTRFIKEVLAQNNVQGKYLINTETGVLCYQCQTPPVEFEITKAYYVPVTYAVAAAEGLSGNIWYSLSGWQESGLLSKNQPVLAYKAYQVWSQQMKDLKFVTENTAVPGIKIYEFKNDTKRVWVAWSADGTLKPANLNMPIKSVTDALGNAKSLPLTQIDIMPLYIELEK